MEHATINIYGPGAIGTLTAHFVAAAGYRVCLVDRTLTSVVRSINVNGSLSVVGGSQVALRPAPLNFLCVRANDVASALAQVCPHLPAGGVLIVVANGWLERIIADRATSQPELTLRWGATTFGVSQKSEGEYVLRSRTGEYYWGPVLANDRAAHPVEEQLVSRCPEMTFLPDARTKLVEKWLCNMVINTMCGAYRLSNNGMLLERTEEVAAVFDEALALAQEKMGSVGLDRDVMFGHLLQLIKLTEANENSMARDVRLGRPTEAAFFSALATDPARHPNLRRLHALLPE